MCIMEWTSAIAVLLQNSVEVLEQHTFYDDIMSCVSSFSVFAVMQGGIYFTIIGLFGKV